MILALSLSAPQPGCATGPPDLPRLFADCAGRYSAMTEHLWLFDGPASDITAIRRDALADLVGAVEGPDATQLRAWRIEAKAAQAALLSEAAFNGNARAAATARAFLRQCDGLLPGA